MDPFTSLLSRLPSVHHRRTPFPDTNHTDRILRIHLEHLGALHLADYLVWFPYDRFTDVTCISKDGTHEKVYRGTITSEGEGTEKNFALKQARSTKMDTELVLNVCLTAYGDSPTVPLVGLSQHPEDTHGYLMVFDYAQYGTLGETHLQDPYDWHRVAQISSRLARRLADLHKFGYVHHDLHPGNIMYVAIDEPRLIDLALATPIEDTVTQTSDCGCEKYLSPEFFSESKQTSASDVYSFATLLWQLVTGVPPKGDSSNAPNGRRERMIPSSPREFKKVLRDCWSLNPFLRPSMEQVYEQLSGWRDSYRGAAVPFSPQTTEFVKKLRAGRDRRFWNVGSMLTLAPFFFHLGMRVPKIIKSLPIGTHSAS